MVNPVSTEQKNEQAFPFQSFGKLKHDLVQHDHENLEIKLSKLKVSHNTEIHFFRLFALVFPQPDSCCQLRAEGRFAYDEEGLLVFPLNGWDGDYGPSPEQNCLQ